MQGRDILVSIASYCDRELANTVRDLLSKCSDPKRLDIIIINQSEKPENLPEENVLEMWVDYRKARGVSWARGQIMAHINQYHKYFLQIDAHCRFYDKWDLTMINNLDDEWDVISTFPYPHDYIPIEVPGREYRPLSTNRFNHKTADGALMFGGGPVPDRASLRPSSISAAMIFAPIKFLKDVPIDSRMNWNHEQSDLTIRAFLKGYNIKSIEHPPVTHIYGTCHARQNRTNDHVISEQPSYTDDVRTMEQFEVLYGINYEKGINEAMITVMLFPQLPYALKLWKNHLRVYGFTAHSKALFAFPYDRKDIDDDALFEKMPRKIAPSLVEALKDYDGNQVIEIVSDGLYHSKLHKKYKPKYGEIYHNEQFTAAVMTISSIRELYAEKSHLSLQQMIFASGFKSIVDNFDHINDFHTSSSK